MAKAKTAKPVESKIDEPFEESKVESQPVNHAIAIKELVSSYHKRAYKIDVRQVWETAWRVNVYFSDSALVPRISMPYSYFVKLDSDNSLLYEPNLGVKS